MADNSDYTKPRTNLFDLLPEVYQSDTNRSVFENLFNRFLTKQETKRVSGYIGDGNPNAVVKRQIQEFNVHRQAYQLQPILYNKIGSVEWMSSWKDLLNEAERLGIDPEAIQEWLSLLQFNWAPPIDIDKLIHYQDYYWYDEDNPSSKPQFITIRSRCATATSYANFQESLVEEYGSDFPVLRAASVDDVLPTFDIISLIVATSQIVVSGDVTDELSDGQFLEVTGTLGNNGVYQLDGDPIFDTLSGNSVIQVAPGAFPGADEVIGSVKLERYDKFVITGDYGRLMEPGFVFFFKHSSNEEINDSFLIVTDSEYDESNTETTVTLSMVFTDRRVDGVVSLSEKLAAAQAARDCQCTGSIGWDLFQWDDNPDTPEIWHQDTPYLDPCGNIVEDFNSLIASISNAGPPGAPCGENQLWWDTDADILYQYSSATGWKTIWNAFSILVEDTRGAGLWDLTLGCGVQTVVSGSEQWITANKWLHKTDVPNFAIAKQASVPIIEFDWDLELNEWTYTTYNWKYRSETLRPFDEIDAEPDFVELVPLTIYERESGVLDSIVFDARYGDMTEYFAPGREMAFPTVTDVFEVVSSSYVADNPGESQKTRVTFNKDIVAPEITFGNTDTGTESIINTSGSPADPAPLRPLWTSQGDAWKGYNVHWVYVSSNASVPIVHQPKNSFTEIGTTQPVINDVDYDYTFTYYAQQYSITSASEVSHLELAAGAQPGSSLDLRHRAMAGMNDVRVYINGIRQYGTFNEDADAAGFVTGVTFLTGYGPTQFDEVLIEVGEATPADFGRTSVPVRTIEDDYAYAGSSEPTYISLVKYRKEEQVKTQTNQYPLFDMYNVDGTPAYKASPLFAFVTDSSQPVNGAIQMRLVTGSTGNNFLFQQYLVDEDDGTMYAYRDYVNQTDNIWVDLDTLTVNFWDGLAWSEYKIIDRYFMKAIVQDYPPELPWENINGVYWLDTLEKVLKVRNVTADQWVPAEAYYGPSDPTLQTVWKKGLNDELYVPQKRDWEKRTLEEYNEQKAVYVEELAEELMLDDSSLTEPDAIAQAEMEWNSEQANHLSPTGAWVGDWEIPDPLYYNYGHENRRQVSMSELITHFDTIIKAQPKIPGYSGPRKNMFHLIPSNDVNYGLGGTIREFNYGFDTFLSALFSHQVSPRTLIEFAQDQYEVLLNSLEELYRRDSVELFTTISTESLSDMSKFIVDTIIETYEQNDATAALYGDSTTFFDRPGTTDDVGVRNWIATLPFLGMVENRVPAKVVDEDHELNQIIHHDGHRSNYFLADATVESIIRNIVDSPDVRTVTPGSNDEPKPFGVIPNTPTPPPNNTDEFELWFDTSIANREGVYWYYVNGPDRTLYRLEVAEIGTTVPSSTVPDGTLWLDLRPGLEALRVKTTNPNTGDVDWEVPKNIIVGEDPVRLHNGTDPSDISTAEVSAWTRIDLNSYLTDVIFEVEHRLHSVAPDYSKLKYDFDALKQQYTSEYQQYLEEQFLAYTSEAEIIAPLSNSAYSASDPFTWNYKHSTVGRGYQIVDIDTDDNAFIISGHFQFVFDPCKPPTPTPPGWVQPPACTGSGVQVTFYVKNNGPNDGTWTVVSTSAHQTAEDICSSGSVLTCTDDNKFTKIYVNEPITNVVGGTIYQGILPSTANDGSESGGDWRDLYQKALGTPYPHLEPWSLQGYVDKPDWWDQYYLNDDPKKWGSRRWKYKHGFDIADAINTTDIFEIDGEFIEVFPTGKLFTVDNSVGVQNGQWQVGKIGDVVSVTPGPATSASLEIAGDHVTTFTAGTQFAIISSTGQIVKTLTVASSFFTGPPTSRTIIVVEEEIVDITDFDVFGGATYDPDTNRTSIRIDTSALSPVRSDITVNGPGGRIAISYGMWNNIIQGEIPPGVSYPNGVISVTGDYQDVSSGLISSPLPTFNYLCVNIDNHEINTGGSYQPDDVFPPYWNYSQHFGATIPTFDSRIRSIFSQLSTEILSESADYSFGDAGYVEWVWRNSSQFLYDQLTVAFRIDPVRFMYLAFGPEYHQIAGLLIDKRLEQVMSHANTEFHGDIINDKEVLKFNGINQWYVNYLRYTGVDISMSDFRTSWTQWTAPMMYQFSSFIDTPSLDVAHRQVCISEFDYRIASKRSPGAEDYWLDSFDIYTLSIPPKLARYDNEFQWKFEITTKPPYTKTVSYYDVQNYQFYADPDTDLCTMYSWLVDDMSFFNDTFTVRGDQTEFFAANRTFDVVESTDNNGTYTIISSVYNAVTDQTLIQVSENVTGVVKDGRIILNYRALPWQTGEAVVLSTHETLPAPLQMDNTNGVYYYFFIRETHNTFRLATTRTEAEAGNYVNITTKGRSDHYVGKVQTTFTDGVQTSKFWRHYALDTATVRTFMPPYDVSGFQGIINIIDGYEQYTKDQGWRFNVDGTLRDPGNTTYAVNWQHELRRFIQYNYNLRAIRTKVEDRFPVTVNVGSNVWTITDNSRPYFITGDPVTIFSSNGVYPPPLVRGGRYYMIRDEISNFRLAATKADATAGVSIDITDDAGTEKLFLTKAAILTQNAPRFELNPFRNAVWFRPERGIVSNLLTGPTDDVFTSQLMVDQYGRPMNQDAVRIFREDKETKITIEDQLDNDVEPIRITQNPYNYIHLGAVHLFVDTYEHVMVFNDNTTEGQLLYDPFVGLNLTKFEMLFNRQLEFTQRPNVGGQYLSTFYNQGADLNRNIEASIEDLRNLYDTYQVIEANELVLQSRKTMGYEGREDYLDNLNLNAKSQFAFWRGQIQTKGAMSSVNAFVNSRRFIDAKVDEFWAYKIGEFGSSQDKDYIEMWLKLNDARSDELRLQFVSEDDLCDSGYAANVYDSACGFAFPISGTGVLVVESGWTGISITDSSRWVNYPDQLAELNDNNGILYFDLRLRPEKMLEVSSADPSDIIVSTGSPATTDNYIRHNFACDFVTITGNLGYPANHYIDSTVGSVMYPMAADGRSSTVSEYIPFSNMVRVFKGTYNTSDPAYDPSNPSPSFIGEEMINGVDYIEVASTDPTELRTNRLQFAQDLSGYVVRVIYGTATLLSGVHYDMFNSNVVHVLSPHVIDGTLNDAKVWGWTFDKESINPHKLIDTLSETVLATIQYWDPARGHHYYNGIHVVDLQGDTDPAAYSNTLETDEGQCRRIAAGGICTDPTRRTAENDWNKPRVGTTWMDTSRLGYVPYYDPAVYDSTDEQYLQWGTLADWADVKIYAWVESDVHPEEWNALAEAEEGNTTIDQRKRKSGRTFKTLFRDNGGEWEVARDTYEEFDVLFDAQTFGTETEFQVTEWVDVNNVDLTVYVNGRLVDPQPTPSSTTGWRIISPNTIGIFQLEETDRVRVVEHRPGYNPTLDDDTNAANLEAALSGSPQMWMEDYQYTVDTYYDRFDIERSVYYFWVEDKVTRGTKSMSPQAAQDSMVDIPIPYAFYDDVRQSRVVTFEGETVQIPVHFTRSVIRGIRDIINDSDRYAIRWTRDHTLRDTLDTGTTALEKKQLHEQWELIRREMPYHIPRALWDKVTESIVQYKLNDPTTRVPSYQRELYDEENGTDTRYGLRDGQAFTDGTLALATIIADLNNPDNDFKPVDINVFFQQHSFDTAEDIVDSMNTIYNTFPFVHVNRMFFDVLLDAFSVKRKYEDIFKTSMVALHGIRPFQVGGLFDD